MAELGGDYPQGYAGVAHVGGEGVAQSVGVDPFLEFCFLGQPGERPGRGGRSSGCRSCSSTTRRDKQRCHTVAMEAELLVPSYGDLIDRVFTQVPDVSLSGTGFGLDRSADEDGVPGEFAFFYAPPGRWRLDRPHGRLRAVGDHRREVMQRRDGATRRAAVGAGWSGEPACWLLRPALTGVSAEDWLSVEVVESPTRDVVADRPCWRVTMRAKRDDEVRLWFDAELPLLLRHAAGSETPKEASLFAELVELNVGAVDEQVLDHPLLHEALHVPLDAVPADAEPFMQSIRTAVPEAQSVELCRWAPTGAFVVRLMIPTARGDAEVIVDRRPITDPPYEGTHAGLVRTGNAQWDLSLDHDPECDRAQLQAVDRRLRFTEGIWR